MDKKRYAEGLLMLCAAFIIWGLLPLYWKWVSAITPYEIFAQRVIWSFLFIIILMRNKARFLNFMQVIKQPKNLVKTIGPAIFISLNWLTYIWGVNNGFVLEASLGYYINPLVLTMFGRFFFKEHLTRDQKIAISLAIVGVVYKTFSYGRVPYIAIILAFSFGIYGLLKKKSTFTSLTGLGVETLLIGLPAMIYLVYIESQHMGIIGNLPTYYWLRIMLSGALTAIPLLLYSEGTKRLPLSIIGFLQYIAPTISLFLGIFVFKESFDVSSLIAFVFIWIGLAIFTREQIVLFKTQNRVSSADAV